MRVQVALLGALSLVSGAGCSPEIQPGTYYCGPERFCPPSLECDDPTYTCEAPSLAAGFACPDGSEAHEPDDRRAEALEAGETRCGDALVEDAIGCLEGEDVDLIRVTYDDACSGDPRLEISVRFVIAFAPATLELLDAGGEVVAVGEPCRPASDLSGTDHLCIEARPPAGTYLVRIRLGPVGDGDCGGECRNNVYELDVATPIS